MFTAIIREIKARGTAADPWTTLTIPPGTKPGVKNTRLTLSATYDEPVRIPAALHVTLEARSGKSSIPVLAFEYPGGGIPTVRSKTIDADVKSPDLVALEAAAGKPVGVCRTVMPSTPEEIEADFPGYGALPAEKWVQLNTTDDQFVVQLKLQKMAPEDVHRDLGAGVYYIYGVTRLVVHVAAAAGEKAPEPKTDKDRALLV